MENRPNPVNFASLLLAVVLGAAYLSAVWWGANQVDRYITGSPLDER